MNTLSVRLRYRPVRIGWCVAPGDFEAVRRAMRLSFTMWGGRFNPIIPTGNRPLAEALTKLFRVDALHPTSDDPVTSAFVDDQKHLPWPGFDKALFSGLHEAPARPRARFVDISHPIGKIHEEHYRNNPAPPSVFRIYRWDPADPLADVFLATFGAYPDPAEIGIDYAAMERFQISAQDVLLQDGGPVPSIEPGTASVALLNREGIERHYAVQNFWDHAGLYVGSAGNFDDLITYWNLRAAEIPITFFDPEFTERLTPLKDQSIELAKRRPRRWGNEAVAVWSRTQLPPEIVDGIVPPDTIRSMVTVNDEGIWNGLNIKAPIPIFGDGTALASVDASQPKATVSFALGDQPFLRDRDLDDQSYVLSIDPGIGLFGDERTTLHTPFIPALNEYYGRNCHFEWDKARAEPDSLGLVENISTQHVHLTGLPVSDLIAEIFQSVGVAAAPSKPGRICTTLIDQMGGLSGCRVFKIEGVRSLIEGHAPDQSFSRSDAMQAIQGQGDVRPLSEYQGLYIERRKIGSPLKNDGVLGYLLDKGVFRVGLDYRCPSCELEFWRPLDDAKVQLDCDYCGHHFNGSRQLRDRSWAFRRSGLFGRDDHQEGAIPVTLTLQQLVGRGSLSEGIYCTAMALDGRAEGRKKCETDFVIVAQHPSDNKIDIVLGECKTRGAITDEDVENLSSIADAFPSDRFNTYIVFSKLTSFTEEELERVKRANSRYRNRVILFTERELEPYRPYDRASEEFEIERYGVSFDDMVRNTDIIFYRKQRRAPVEAEAAIPAASEPVEADQPSSTA